MTTTKLTIAKIRKAAGKVGGRLVSDGCGGYDLLAPDGKKWAWSETWCQPIPLGEADGQEDKESMLQWAMDCATGGLEDS